MFNLKININKQTYIAIHATPEVGVVNWYGSIQHWSNYQPASKTTKLIQRQNIHPHAPFNSHFSGKPGNLQNKLSTVPLLQFGMW